MSYCPKCGNKVDETMAFCPRCGTSLKGAAATEPGPPEQPDSNEKTAKTEKQEKQERPVKGENQEKSEHGFVGYLMGGLIFVTIGIFALLDLTNPVNSSQDLAAMLLIIGIIIIIGAIYIAITTRKRVPASH